MSEDLDAVDFHYFIEAFERQWTHFGLAFVNLAIMRGRLPLGRLYRCAWGVIDRRARLATATTGRSVNGSGPSRLPRDRGKRGKRVARASKCRTYGAHPFALRPQP